jgi:hypothetical protein
MVVRGARRCRFLFRRHRVSFAHVSSVSFLFPQSRLFVTGSDFFFVAIVEKSKFHRRSRATDLASPSMI